MRSAGANTNGFLRAIKLALTCAYVVIAAVGVHAGEGPGTLWQGAQQALAARDGSAAEAAIANDLGSAADIIVPRLPVSKTHPPA